MGFISQLAESSKQFPGQRTGREVWREIFGETTNKERDFPRVLQPTPGGSYGRSFAGAPNDASFIRLLQSMRSMAPGGWSDDRWEQTRNFEDIVYTCIHRTGEQLSQSEFNVYHKDLGLPSGKRPVKRGEPEYKLIELLERPNNDDSFGSLMYRWCQQLNLTGSALTWMVPNRLGTPMELYSIPTCIAIPQPAVNPDFPDGYYRIQPVYPYGPFSSYPTPTSAVGAPIPAQWMIKFKYPHPLLHYDGFSPLTALNMEIDEIKMMDRSRFYKMKRGSNPDAVVTFDTAEGMQPVNDAQIDRMHAEWENSYQGPENHGRLIVASPGANIEPWGGPSPREMDFVGSWDQLTSFVMGAGFGITKPVAGMVDEAAYATLFAALKQFHLLTLSPICARFAQGLTRHLAPFFGQDLIVEINCQRIDDHDVRNAKISTAVSAFCITKNEVRMELGLSPTEEPWGTEIAGIPPPPPMPPGGLLPPGEEGELPPEALGLTEEEVAGGGLPLEEPQVPEQELAATQPGPGALGEGALGPRKHLNRIRHLRPQMKIKNLSTYEKVTKAISLNGNGVVHVPS